MSMKEWLSRVDYITFLGTIHGLLWAIPCGQTFLQAAHNSIWLMALIICFHRWVLNFLLDRLPPRFHWLFIPLLVTAMIVRLSWCNYTPTVSTYVCPNNIISISWEHFANVTR